MARFAVKAYVGPCGVREIADKLRATGLESVSEGTKHVYAVCEGGDRTSAAHMANKLAREAYPSDWIRFRCV